MHFRAGRPIQYALERVASLFTVVCLNLTLDQWLKLDVESRARHIALAARSSEQPEWATEDVLIGELFDLYPAAEHDQRVYVDLSGIDFLGPDFLRSFYDSRGFCRESERRSAGELRELRSFEQFGDARAPDLGHDLDHDAKVEDYIRSQIVRDLSSMESSVHEQMLARGQPHAYVDRYELEISTELGMFTIVLILVVSSSGQALSVMPWDEIADWKELLDGDWVEIGALEDDFAATLSWSAKLEGDGGDNDSSDDPALIDAQGMDLSLPEPDEATPAEEESWRDQLLAEYDDDDSGDIPGDEPAADPSRPPVEDGPESGFEWKL